MASVDDLIRRLPWPLQRVIHRSRERRADRRRAEQAPRDVFTGVYENRRWGTAGDARFYSGWGSHEAPLVDAYVAAVTAFLRGFPAPPDVVDIGCGDFNVGKRIRPACARYIACDVVPALIEHNRATFGDLDVDFRCLDATAEPLPPGEVVFIRQVLQHLSNAQIERIVPKLPAFAHVVLTEHLPASTGFWPNRDKGAGDDVRAGRVDPSAVVLTAPPFDLRPRRSRVLCEVPSRGGRIQTIAYEL